jgi:hypothetical protein
MVVFHIQAFSLRGAASAQKRQRKQQNDDSLHYLFPSFRGIHLYHEPFAFPCQGTEKMLYFGKRQTDQRMNAANGTLPE